MNAGLLYLLRTTPRGRLRRLARRLRGLKGFLVILGATLLFALILGPQVFVYTLQRDPERLQDIASSIRRWGPPASLFLVLLVGVSRGALYFRPAEIQFLFSAPVSRRELLLYNVVSKLRVQLLSALWLGCFMLQHTMLWYAAFVAAFLFLAFVQLTAQASGLLLATIDQALAKSLKRLGLVALALVSGGVLVAATTLTPRGTSFMDMARAVVEHPAVRTVSFVTRPFVEVFVADSPANLAVWSAMAIGIVGVEVLLLLGFDAAYTEGALVQARTIQRMLRRLRSGGGALAASGPAKLRFSIPPFPQLGGAGPLAWRQCQELSRNISGVLRVGLFMFLWILVFMIAPAMAGTEPKESHHAKAVMPLMMIIFFAPMMTMHLAFDFRRDLDRMVLLKSLPVSPFALCCGQLVAMTLLMAFWQSIGVGVIAVMSGELPLAVVVGLIIVVFPLNWAIASVDNTIFLLMPYRYSARDPGGHPFMGRLMLVAFLKLFATVLVAGFGALAGYA
ncbi:MAG: putative ABC exporter domain-containing protein, partial [Planctomycetota bacterium]